MDSQQAISPDPSLTTTPPKPTVFLTFDEYHRNETKAYTTLYEYGNDIKPYLAGLISGNPVPSQAAYDLAVAAVKNLVAALRQVADDIARNPVPPPPKPVPPPSPTMPRFTS